MELDYRERELVASASLGSLLEMQALGPTSGILSPLLPFGKIPADLEVGSALH